MKKIFILAAAVLVLASCDNNDDNTDFSPGQARITATIGETTGRAKDTSWSPGDSIGITSSVDKIVAPYINVKYTTDGSGTFSGKALYFYKPMTLTAYYPYTGSDGTLPGFIKASTDAGNQTAKNQPQIDFLWDTKTNEGKKDFSAADPTVKFTFAHKMSKLMFVFKGSEEVEENGTVIATAANVSDIVSYEIEGLVMDGSFDTATGICAIDNTAETKVLKIDLGKGSVEEGQPVSPLIVFPQKPGNSKVKLHIYTDELENPGYLQHYVCMLTFGDGELKPGNSYKYTVTISKIGLKLSDMEIVNWNDARDVNLTGTIDGGVKKDE